jgi:hypothetical protein
LDQRALLGDGADGNLGGINVVVPVVAKSWVREAKVRPDFGLLVGNADDNLDLGHI